MELKVSKHLRYSSYMDIRTHLSALGTALKRLACTAKLPAIPPPNARRKNLEIKKLGSRQTPYQRSTVQIGTEKGRLRGRKFRRVTRRHLRPLHQPLPLPQNQP